MIGAIEQNRMRNKTYDESNILMEGRKEGRIEGRDVVVFGTGQGEVESPITCRRDTAACDAAACT